MQLAHLLHELLLGLADVEQRLARLGVAEEDDEVDGMTLAQRDADLRVVLEAADTRAVPGARVDDHVGSPLRVDAHALRRHDAHQRIVDRTGELPAVNDHLVVEMQDRRQSRTVVLDEIVATLAQRIPEQDRALREIGRVGVPVRPGLGWRDRLQRNAGHAVDTGLGEPLAKMLLCDLGSLLIQLRDLVRDFVASCDLRGCVHERTFSDGRGRTMPWDTPPAMCAGSQVRIGVVRCGPRNQERSHRSTHGRQLPFPELGPARPAAYSAARRSEGIMTAAMKRSIDERQGWHCEIRAPRRFGTSCGIPVTSCRIRRT